MLFVSEIYRSVQGESSYVGKPCVFVRLTGCHLRCNYCDSEHAFHGGTSYSVEEVVQKVIEYDTDLVELTGGEPLLQKDAIFLLKSLTERGFTVLLETSGSLSLKHVPEKVVIIMDIKCPSSGEEGHFLIGNMAHVKTFDEIKFVIADKMDFDWSVHMITEANITVPILFSPVHNVLHPKNLAEWMLSASELKHMNTRLQIQIHKYIWGSDAQRV